MTDLLRRLQMANIRRLEVVKSCYLPTTIDNRAVHKPSLSTLVLTCCCSPPVFPAEIQAYDGLAPEIINSRLAMLGFAVAAYFELVQGKDVFQQVKAYPLLTVATFVIFSVASWIPFLQGQSYNVKSGPFTLKVGRTECCLVAECDYWFGSTSMRMLVQPAGLPEIIMQCTVVLGSTLQHSSAQYSRCVEQLHHVRDVVLYLRQLLEQ